MSAIVEGQKGFFVPRFPPPSPLAAGVPQAASYYDTAPLKATLERLCDFDRINSGEMRVSVGAVNVATGNFAYFDNTRIKLRPEHFMASGALPPGFAAVEIDGEYFWDGGLMSNTPLYEVAMATPRRDTLAFQVDLWSARGPVPDSIVDVMGRVKDMQYLQPHAHGHRHDAALAALSGTCCGKCWITCPRSSAQRFMVQARRGTGVLEALQRDPPDLPAQGIRGALQGFQFGLSTMREHWESGLQDIRGSLAHRDWLEMPNGESRFITHDIHRDRPLNMKRRAKKMAPVAGRHFYRLTT